MGWIGHSDANSFYCSVELLFRPELRDKPVVVGGDEEARHGIVLTKNQIAKKFGIKTGVALVEARRYCPDLISLPPNYPLHLKYANLIRDIYSEYTDRQEAFGLDEYIFLYRNMYSYADRVKIPIMMSKDYPSE